MTDVIRVLFLCRDNACRSIIAEAVMNHLGGGRYQAVSAGPRPAGKMLAKTIEILRKHGIEPGKTVSQSWNDYSTRSFDMIVTVCDETAQEAYPVFPGKPRHLFWNIPDLSGTSTEAEGDEVFEIIRERVERLMHNHNNSGGGAKTDRQQKAAREN